jgi:transposase
MKKKKPTSKRSAKLPKHLLHLNQHAAGIDIGSRSHFVAVPEGTDDQPVREFSTFTDDLERLAKWLISCGVTTVAMESTGIYWIPVFEILEYHGLEVRLVNARIQRMQKALAQMNLQLHNVVTDITGVTGMSIIKAILAGERKPHVQAALRDKRCKNSEETIARSLHGNYRPEHLFSLQQAFELYEFYQQKIADCDRQILAQLRQFDSPDDSDPDSKPPRSMEEALQRMSGTDLSSINGINTNTALKIIAEIGIDMSRWKTVKHFTSWLGLCPGSKISGGKVLSSATKPVANRAAAALRMAAMTLFNSKSALGAYFRRQRSRLGAPKAITATAHKLARLIYNMLKYDSAFVDSGQEQYEERYRSRVLQGLKRKAQEMGYKLVSLQEEPQTA